MRITAPSRERGNPRGAVAIVASLFTVAFVILMLPRDREPARVAALPAHPHGVMTAFAIPATADQPAIRATLPPAVHATNAPVAIPHATRVEIPSADVDVILTFSHPVAELPVLAAKPLLAAGTPAAMVMSPPAIEADGDDVISTAFRQTGAAVRIAFRKTGEGVKAAFTSLPW